MLLRLTLHFVSLFRRYAPYASRLSAKSKHKVLAFCFQKKEWWESESPRKAFVTKFSPADATLRSAIPSIRSLRLAAPLPKASTLCLLFVFKKKSGGRASLHAKHL